MSGAVFFPLIVFLHTHAHMKLGVLICGCFRSVDVVHLARILSGKKQNKTTAEELDDVAAR